MDMAVILGLTSALLLALVAGLLIAVGLELRALKPSLRGAPLLAEQLTAQVLGVKQLLVQLKAGVGEVAPTLGEAERLRQDLQYLVARAEQLAARLEGDGTLEGTVTTQTPLGRSVKAAVEARVEEIARSNGVAATNPARVAQDPLEELLAGLEAAAPVQEISPETMVKTSSRSRKGSSQPSLPVVV